MGRRVRIVVDHEFDNDYITLDGARDILATYDFDDVRNDLLEGKFSFHDDYGDEPLVREESVTLTVTVRGPKSVLARYNGEMGGEDLADLFYGIGDAGIAEVLDSVVR